MTDWASHHPARRSAPLGWLAAASLASLLAASTSALGFWLDRRAGTGTAPAALLLDLPPIEALAEPPPAAPLRKPEAPSATPPDPAPPKPAAETAPDLAPPPGLAPTAPSGSDQPQADTPPPKPKPAKSGAKAQKQAAPTKPAAAAASPAPTATAQGDGATASAMQKWLNQAQRTLGRHMARKGYGGTGRVTLLFSVAASGQITAASLQGTTSDPEVDAAILAQARRAPALPPRPDGKTGRLALPVRLRG